MSGFSNKESGLSPNARAGFWRGCYRERLCILAIILITLAGNFLYVDRFGFYEDDYWAVVPFLHVGGGRILDQFHTAFLHWPQGRPLNHSLPMLFGWLGFQSGHIWGIYALCSVVIVANTLLLYRILRVMLGLEPAVAGALFFALYPADTTRSFIVHGAHLQTGLTLCLSGLLLFRFGGWRRVLAYPVAGMSLLAYETTFLPFLIGVPVFVLLENKPRWRRRMGLHALGCASILSVVATMRICNSDSRAEEALGDMRNTFWRMASSLWIGPVASLKALLFALTHVTVTTGWEGMIIALCALVVFMLLKEKAGGEHDKGNISMRTLAIVFTGGICLWVGSYGLTIINYPPNCLCGRMTSVHMAGAIGAAFAFSASLGALLRLAEAMQARKIIAGLLAVFFALLMANGLGIQRDYIAAWRIQKDYWKHLLAVAPDLRADDLVIVYGKKPAQPKAILANSWADTLVLGETLDFEGKGTEPLSLWITKFHKSNAFKKQGNALMVRPKEWMPDELEYNPEKAVIVELEPEGWRRLENLRLPGGIALQGRALDATGSMPPLVLTEFGRLLLEPGR